MRLFFQVLQIVLILLNKYDTAISASCSSAYGAKPCPYVPSPPGERPPCAQHGYTYCEYPEHYPRDLVMHLLEKWKYDHGTLLQNETPATYGNKYPVSDTYGPPTNSIQPYSYSNPVYGPPATSSSPNSYIPPPPRYKQPYTAPSQNYPAQHSHPQFPYNSDAYQQVNQQQFLKHLQPPEFNRFHQNVWSKWNGTKFYKRRKRALVKKFHDNAHSNATMMSLLSDMPTLDRKKRQSGGGRGGMQLCESFSQFIMPRAAMNSKGDWMYVVNVPEVDGRYSQLVKSETCARTGRCSNLCSLPDGYNSQCEQRFVQKRLIAVEPGGSNLYTDVFWFPSCCLCTINRL